MATRRVWWQVISLGVLGVLTAQAFFAYQPRPEGDSWWVNLVFSLVFAFASMATGMYVGSRRELLWTLRDRAERAEAEAGLRLAQARGTERARIAREMHDVLAHRISLVAMHAGALAYRTDLTAEEVRRSAAVIQEKAHEALQDLRQVLGVLRDDGVGAGAHRPQPTLADVVGLVDEAATAGMQVDHLDTVARVSAVPDHVGRTAYRIVQEGLTNARKHAPGAHVQVRVTGSAAQGVTVRVSNPSRTGHVSSTPGAGLGLVGLAERLGLAGGRLDHRAEGGSFVLEGWLPWGPVVAT